MMDSKVGFLLVQHSKIEKDLTIWSRQIQCHRNRERLGYDWLSGKDRGKPPSV